MSKDEEKDINVTFPEDYHSEDLKGQKVVFKVKVNEIKTTKIPELDKDFFEDLAMEGIDSKESLEKQLEEANANKDSIAKQLADAQTALKAAEDNEAAAKNELDALKDKYMDTLEKVCKKELVFTNLDELFGEADATGVYTAETGTTYNLNVALVYTYTPEGADEPTFTSEEFELNKDDVVLDYIWEDTFDYNSGLTINGNSVRPTIKGLYAVNEVF